MTRDEVIADLQSQIAQLHQRLDVRTFELDVLDELATRLSDSRSYDQLVQVLLTQVGQAVSYDVAASLLCTGQEPEVYFHEAQPLAPAVRHEIEQRLLAACRPPEDASAAVPRALKTVTVMPPSGITAGPVIERLESTCLVPIEAAGRTAGALFVGSARTESFREDQIRLLHIIARQASAAVERLHHWARSERSRLKAIVDHLPEGIVLLDQNNVVVLANPQGRHLLNVLGGVSVGEKVTRLGVRTLQELAEQSSVDLIAVQPVPRTLEAVAVPLEGERREAASLLVLRDVTESREEVRRRDRFMAMLAHELRNPLAPILNAINIMDSPDASRQTVASARLVLARQVRHMVHLVDELLDVSRFLHDKITLQKETIHISDLVRFTVESHQPDCECRKQNLSLEIQDNFWVLGDRTRLTQVVANLISNAIKYTPRGGQIWVACEKEFESVVIRVRDSGMGICGEKLPLVFDPFMQVDDTLARSGGGLGLGLALVKVLVNLHGGTVTAASDGEDCGCTFTVRLPLIASPTPVAPGASLSKPAAHRVLIIEDNDDAREMLKSLLELDGHHVFTARTGVEGVAVFRDCNPDLALVDIGLPEMDGYQVARAIRSDARGRAVYLAALTGYAQPKDRVLSREAGFDAHLAKPLDVDQLDALLKSFSVEPKPV